MIRLQSFVIQIAAAHLVIYFSCFITHRASNMKFTAPQRQKLEKFVVKQQSANITLMFRQKVFDFFMASKS